MNLHQFSLASLLCGLLAGSAAAAPRKPVLLVVAHAQGGPACRLVGRVFEDNQLPTRWNIENNCGIMAPSRSIGSANTSQDDVWVHGLLVTGEDYDSASLFGKTLAREIAKREQP